LIYNSKKSKFVWMPNLHEWTSTEVGLFIDKTSSGDIPWNKLEDSKPLNKLS